ncbi:tripartite tricarboxylate transporter TctB family protein [Bacillus sp. JJ722]|uniref:tripartite tricarboxylate transporter TctB family protein n=1 Tax=Bacillus sp. JJ722 TaxID=3122973 RepID=UPI002FFD7BC2
MILSFDRVAAVLLSCVGILFMVGSKQLSTSSYGSEVGPDIFPFWLGAILTLLSIKLFFEALKDGRNKEKEAGQLDIKSFGMIFTLALLYILVLEYIGYVITTFLFLFISFQIMDKGKWVTSLIIAGCFSGAVYYLYVEVLKGTLPGWPIWLM